jgi:hypothetical protein
MLRIELAEKQRQLDAMAARGAATAEIANCDTPAAATIRNN